MSNVMSLKQVRNHVNRDAFDLSQRKLFTAKVGEILPVFCKEVLPGDKFKVELSAFTRTMPVNTAAYTRIKEYYDYFFVPYRLLWRYFDQFITDTNKSNSQFASSINTFFNTDFQTHPYFTAHSLTDYLNFINDSSNKAQYNYFGFNRAALSYKILKYLGYGSFVSKTDETLTEWDKAVYTCPEDYKNLALNAFPLLAYNKICQDYYRNSQWENSNPSTYNVDYLNNSSLEIPVGNLMQSEVGINMFDMRYCNWNKDYFMGLLPSPQYGDVATIGDIGLASTFNVGVKGSVNISSGDTQTNILSNDTQPEIVDGSNLESFTYMQNATLSSSYLNVSIPNAYQSSINVLALRQAEALQKWREISLTGNQDYKDQIEKHFGVNVSSVRSNLCEWLGGSSDNIDINEVVNTNLQGINSGNSEAQSDIAGKGIGVVGGKQSFEATEHGIFMCLYHSVPILDYEDSVTDPIIFKTSRYDYAIPEFDKVGMQSVPAITLSPNFVDFTPSSSTDTGIGASTDKFVSLGYAPRYVEYKTSIDTVSGAFTTTLPYWVTMVNKDYFSAYLQSLGSIKGKLNYLFFMVNPNIMDSVFVSQATGDWDSDTFLINCYNDIKAVRNIDRDGLPY